MASRERELGRSSGQLQEAAAFKFASASKTTFASGGELKREPSRQTSGYTAAAMTLLSSASAA